MNYKCFKIKFEKSIARVIIDHPPINLMDNDLLNELDDITKKIEVNDSIKVVIFESANPDYFMAHANLEYLVSLSPKAPVTPSLGFFHIIGERIRNMPKVSIAKIAGFARGGGSELCLAMDMSFAAKNKAYLGQPEIGVGLIPGGGGTQRLPRLIGRSRALEVILTGEDFSAELAERYGYINRAIPEEELDEFVDSLAKRIADYPLESITAAKKAVNRGECGYAEGLMNEYFQFLKVISNEKSRSLIKKALDIGAQTYEGELDLNKLIRRLYSDDSSI